MIRLHDPEAIEAQYDPCPRRTGGNVPCERARHHVGACGGTDATREMYLQFIAQTRARAQTMTRQELAAAVEYHLIAWRVLRNEYNGR